MGDILPYIIKLMESRHPLRCDCVIILLTPLLPHVIICDHLAKSLPLNDLVILE